jgi:hypothetical protein
MNYTIQDILSSLLAFFLFPLVIVVPGYVFGWAFDLFDFRKRHSFTRYIVALALSVAFSPILFFLAYRLVSGNFALLLLLAFIIGFIRIILRSPKEPGVQPSPEIEVKLQRLRRAALWAGGVWSIFVVVFLSDWQVGNRLYFTVISYDYTTRVSVIDAITRTGVPPLNPSFYPGHPVKLTYLYYFWYILCSIVDQIGGKWVTARTALIASAAWSGLALAAIIGFYLQQRKTQSSLNLWRQALIGSSCLLISGLDILPVTLYTFSYGFGWMWGDIEHWNEQITAWLGSVLWVPLHINGLIAAIVGLLLFLDARQKQGRRKGVNLIFSGLSFASALGLSVFVTLVFVIFWGLWALLQLLNEKDRKQVWLMTIPGIIAALFISPFILDLIQNSAPAKTGNFPFMIDVREFSPLRNLIAQSTIWLRSIAFLAALPFNYLLELGFFLVAGLLWLQIFGRRTSRRGKLYEIELLLLITTFMLATFIRSKIIMSNDFGWRSWLVGQFVLLIWSTDLLDYLFFRKLPAIIQIGKQAVHLSRTKKILIFFIAIGILTTTYDLLLLRIWPLMTDAGVAGFPHMLSRDKHLGERTFAAREMYEYLNNYLPQNSIIQFNPNLFLDRPSGLYRARQSIISTHTLYGVPEEQSKLLMEEISTLFESHTANWEMINQICNKYHISAIVLSDYDPIWKEREQLKATHAPLFENKFFATFECGK